MTPQGISNEQLEEANYKTHRFVDNDWSDVFNDLQSEDWHNFFERDGYQIPEPEPPSHYLWDTPNKFKAPEEIDGHALSSLLGPMKIQPGSPEAPSRNEYTHANKAKLLAAEQLGKPYRFPRIEPNPTTLKGLILLKLTEVDTDFRPELVQLAVQALQSNSPNASLLKDLVKTLLGPKGFQAMALESIKCEFYVLAADLFNQGLQMANDIQREEKFWEGVTPGHFPTWWENGKPTH